MKEVSLKPCPFCGHVPEDWLDSLHRTGTGWRDDKLGDRVLRHYMRRDDPRGVHGECWELSCLTHEGGCGAMVCGDSREEAIGAWNRRTGGE
jgi:sarcosine oxidase delta subunit